MPVESGLRNYRIDFAREASFGDWGADPAFLYYSPVINSFSWESENAPAERRALGSADPVEYQKASESHSFTIEYDMEKWLVDGSGNAEDAAYDGLARDGDNLLPNSHTVVTREDKGAIPEGATVDGASGSKATRIYSVGQGGLIDSVTLTGEAEDAAIVTVELEYMVHKARTYQIDQPDASTELVVYSTSANDTTQTLTIEDEGGATAEDVPLDGTNLVTTTSTFGDVDALELDAQTEGDVVVAVNSGTTTSPAEGAQLAEINGANTYGGNEGDLGVPALGAGSRETLPTDPVYQSFVGDNIQRGNSDIYHTISSMSVSAENDLEDMEVTETYGVELFPGSRELTAEATMFSEVASHDNLVEHLEVVEGDIDWTLTGGTISLLSAVLSEPGAREVEEGQAVMTLDNTFTAQGLNIA